MKLSVKIRTKDKSVFGTLTEMAEAMSQTERSLYRRLLDDSDYAKYKPAFFRQHGITSRQFNSLQMSVEGRLEARKSSLEHEHDKVAAKLTGAIKVIEGIEAERSSGMGTKLNAFVVHQKKRLRRSLELRIKDRAADIKDGARRLCFGGRKLFNAQHHLAENGFADHAQWLAAWRTARSSQFMVVGSTKESFGNQLCQLIMDAAGKGFLNLRVTNGMEAQTGKSHLKIPVQVSYRDDYLRAAIASDRSIAWRFVREDRRWYAIAFGRAATGSSYNICVRGLRGCRSERQAYRRGCDRSVWQSGRQADHPDGSRAGCQPTSGCRWCGSSWQSSSLFARICTFHWLTRNWISARRNSKTTANGTMNCCTGCRQRCSLRSSLPLACGMA